tara:strand:- start:63 stop:275 length:213 start_codon:yes stop_codon:yes gene_type:complete
VDGDEEELVLTIDFWERASVESSLMSPVVEVKDLVFFEDSPDLEATPELVIGLEVECRGLEGWRGSGGMV